MLNQTGSGFIDFQPDRPNVSANSVAILMRIRHLHFTQSVEPLSGAGLGYAALGLHVALLSQGIESRLVATCSPQFVFQVNGVELFPRTGPERAFYSNEMRACAASLARDADVIHGHGFYVGPNWCLGRQARLQSKPMVYHPHGFLDPWIVKRSRWKKWIAHMLFENANFRHTKLWRALSKKEEQQIRDYGIKAPVIVLPNGVELPKERNAIELEKLELLFPKIRPKRLLFMARIHPKKGLDLLIQSWASLPKQFTSEWELAIFGPDEGGYAKVVQEWINESGMAASVRLLGTVSGEAKEAAFRSADLFVLPSYSEGFPMAVLEAASYSLPVVLTNECNFPELSAAGGGWECLAESESLIRALKEAICCDDSERKMRGENGRKLVSFNYSWNSIGTRLAEACNDLC